MNHIINCIIVDDEPLAILIIKEYCKRMPNLNLVATFNNPFDAMDCIKTQRVDLVFLDVEMPEFSGVAFARELNRYPLFIFSTADSHHVKDSIDLRAVDYLLKPYDFERFNNAVVKASERLFSWAFTKNYADSFHLVNAELKNVKHFLSR